MGMRVKFFYKGKPVEVEGDFEITVNEQGITIKPTTTAKSEVKRKTQKAWSKWTPEEESQLIELLNQGLKVEEIAAYLGRTERGVMERIRKLKKAGKVPRDLIPQKMAEETTPHPIEEPVT